MSDYVTREEHQAAIQRLDEADTELRQSISSMERNMRGDYENKIAVAVADVKEAIQISNSDVKSDVGAIQDHLTWQDRTVGGTVLLALMYVLLHFGFHIG